MTPLMSSIPKRLRSLLRQQNILQVLFVRPLDVSFQTTKCFAALRAHRFHSFAVANALHKLLACPRLETDKAENLPVKYYFTHEGLGPVVDLQNQDAFKKLVAEALNPSRAVIWEVKSKYDEGARTVAHGTDAKLAEPLFRFIGEHTSIIY